jgi:hypothetical protein
MPDDLKKRGAQDRAPISTRRISTRCISMGEELDQGPGRQQGRTCRRHIQGGQLGRRDTPRTGQVAEQAARPPRVWAVAPAEVLCSRYE